jgi:hypothetical protein
MMEKTLVTFLLDRSGSMGICRDSTIEAFNGYLDGLKEEPEGIDFTFLQFDTRSLDKLCVAQPVMKVPNLTTATYIPRDGTPLIDAAYKTIKAVEAAVEKDGGSPKVVICIQTDGEENSSTEYTWEELHGLVHEKTKQGWQFNFMGAGIDAYEQGARMGIAAVGTMSYDHLDKAATRASFRAASANTREFANNRSLNTNFSASQRMAAGDRFAPDDLIGGRKPMVMPRPTTMRRVVTPAALDLTTSGNTSDARKKTVPDITL